MCNSQPLQQGLVRALSEGRFRALRILESAPVCAEKGEPRQQGGSILS